MPGGGSKPGERRGGRKAGTPNKASAQRDALRHREQLAREAALEVAEARAAGRKMAKEVLEEFMLLFAGMAAYYQPAPANAPPNVNHSDSKFDTYARLAVDTAHKLAPFQSPTFKAIAVVAPPPQDLAIRDQAAKVTSIDDPVALARVYRNIITATRRRG